MIIEIGITAGDIWKYLEKNGVVPLDRLCKDINRERDVILMSIGWLAREGHVLLEPANGPCGYTVSLRRG